MVVTITGKNPFALQSEVTQRIDQFVKKFGEFGLERIDATEAEETTVVDALRSLPFLVERKLVVIRDISMQPVLAERIEKLLQTVPENIDVIFFEPSIDRRSALFKTLQKKTDCIDVPFLTGNTLLEWVQERAQMQNAVIDRASAIFLVERAGEQQQLLATEIDKLASYDPHITKQTIITCVEPTVQSKIFELLDQVGAGNYKNAQSLYQEQRLQKVEPQKVLSMLVWQLWNIMLAAASIREKKETRLTEAGLSPYVAKKSLGYARSMGTARLKQYINELDRLDMLIKTNKTDPDEALLYFLAFSTE